MDRSDVLVGNAMTVADVALLADTRLALQGSYNLAPRAALTDWIRRYEGLLPLPPLQA